MRRAGRHEAALPTERSEAQPAPRRGAPVERVLALQCSAGNRAVSALLARDSKVKPKPYEPGAPGRRKSYAVLPPVGTIDLESVQWDLQGRRDPKAPAISEIIVTSKMGDHSGKLLQEMLKGTAMNVEIVVGLGAGKSLRLRLKGAQISTYSQSSGGDTPTETWSLHFESMTSEYVSEGSGS